MQRDRLGPFGEGDLQLLCVVPEVCLQRHIWQEDLEGVVAVAKEPGEEAGEQLRDDVGDDSVDKPGSRDSREMAHLRGSVTVSRTGGSVVAGRRSDTDKDMDIEDDEIDNDLENNAIDKVLLNIRAFWYRVPKDLWWRFCQSGDPIVRLETGVLSFDSEGVNRQVHPVQTRVTPSQQLTRSTSMENRHRESPRARYTKIVRVYAPLLHSLGSPITA